MITVELRGIALHGHHGVEAHERERGQRFLFDVWVDVDESSLSDRIKDAVDYREVAAAVREISDSRAYELIETLAAAVAEELLERFPIVRARVRVRKPDVELDVPVEWSGATVERSRS